MLDQAQLVLQWNLSITATLGEQHVGRYTGVAVLQGFRTLSVQISILMSIAS